MSKRSAAICLVCGKGGGTARLISVRALRAGLAESLREAEQDRWSADAAICYEHLQRARVEYQMQRLRRERGELSAVETEISRKAAEHEVAARHMEAAFSGTVTTGQRIADGVARVGGSWPFIGTFVALLVGWIAVNSFVFAHGGFDPYPFILLNLVLSCVAALQAPVIMMSQNRRALRDRTQADEDYRVNLKAELEVTALHEKMDHLLHAQWEQLIEMQELQLELLTELTRGGAASDAD